MKKYLLILTLTLTFLIISCTAKQFPKEEYDKAYEQLISENYTQATAQFAGYFLLTLTNLNPR